MRESKFVFKTNGVIYTIDAPIDSTFFDSWTGVALGILFADFRGNEDFESIEEAIITTEGLSSMGEDCYLHADIFYRLNRLLDTVMKGKASKADGLQVFLGKSLAKAVQDEAFYVERNQVIRLDREIFVNLMVDYINKQLGVEPTNEGSGKSRYLVYIADSSKPTFNVLGQTEEFGLADMCYMLAITPDERATIKNLSVDESTNIRGGVVVIERVE